MLNYVLFIEEMWCFVSIHKLTKKKKFDQFIINYYFTTKLYYF